MELLEEANADEVPANADADTMLPPLPVTPHARNPENSAAVSSKVEAGKVPTDTDTASSAPDLRPTRGSYRNSGRSYRSSAEDAKSKSPPQKSFDKAARSGDSSCFSRPTTAGAETNASTYSVSWRDEWTPGSTSLSSGQKPAGMLFRPLPAGFKKPPPLPPLPMRPPESGSVLTVGTDLQPPPPSLKAPASPALVSPAKEKGEPAVQCASSAIVDEKVLRRISLSANATAATPPPGRSKRLAADAPPKDVVTTPVVSPGGDTTGNDISELDAKGAATVATDLDESRGDFSELARAFTCMTEDLGI